MNLDKVKKCKFFMPCIYTFEVIGLFFLRKLFLMTVYQTVLAYAAICAVGTVFVLLAWKEKKKQKKFWKMVNDSFLMVWSGIHGVIILGFLTCGTFYLTLTQITIVQIVNIFLGIALYWFLYLLLGRSTRAIGLGNIVIGVLGTANYYLMKFRGAPFQLADLKSAGTAVNVVKNYDFRLGVLLIVGILDLVLWYLMWRAALTEEKEKERRWNPVVIAVTVVVSCGCIALPLGKYDKVYAEMTQFSQDTYLAALLAEAIGSRQTLPEDYSAEEVEKIVTVYREGVGAGAPAVNAEKENAIA